MTTLTIRILQENKENLGDAAKRLGFTRMENGELSGNISALLVQLAQALPKKSPEEIKNFLFRD